jgi:hypothetical protein
MLCDRHTELTKNILQRRGTTVKKRIVKSAVERIDFRQKIRLDGAYMSKAGWR